MEAEPYVAQTEALQTCPACGGTTIVTFNEYSACATCKKAWENIPAGEHYKRDGELMPFHKPCDNCAFRGGSNERKDKDYWRSLQQQLEGLGGLFYCHRGVPFELATDGTHSPFEYPMRETVAMGEKVNIHDTEKMRLCRGYLNAHVLPELKKDRRAR
jgi:hypothetical protein